jgi:multisubunit Na+/H+ antiporter MnhE subunit
MAANYNHFRLMGSFLLGFVFALVTTFVFYRLIQKPQTLLIFIPLIVVFTRILLWTWRRAETEYADTVRRRYKSGKLPLGGREVGHVSAEKLRDRGR